MNGSYASQGKAGAAILGHHQSNNVSIYGLCMSVICIGINTITVHFFYI